jgi:hypothetical protein
VWVDEWGVSGAVVSAGTAYFAYGV